MIRYWAGSEESFELVQKAQLQIDVMAKAGTLASLKAGFTGSVDSHGLPKLWRHEGDQAVIEINGPLINGEAGWLRFFGVTGYDDIARAAVEAAMDPDTKGMLYHINTPGGDVAGVMDCGALLGQLSGMKPAAVHTSDQCCSAGMWLATSISTDGNFSAGETAITGSIGVLNIHVERTKQLAEDGVKVTVLRSGQFKAETNPYEELTPEAKARAESQLADVHTLFRAQIARGRPNLAADDLAEVTQGQTFLGKRGVKAGLIDRTGSFEQALKLLDKRKQPSNTSPNPKGKAMKIILSNEQIAAIAAGAPLASLGIDANDLDTSDAATAKAKADADAAAAAAAAAASTETVVDPAAPATGGATIAAPPADAGVVSLLKEQLAEANAEITKLKIDAAGHATMAATHDDLVVIARAATANMLIPLGGSAAAVDGLDAAAVVAEHARLKPLFQARFPVGQRSQAIATDEKGAGKVTDTPLGFQVAMKSAPTVKR